MLRSEDINIYKTWLILHCGSDKMVYITRMEKMPMIPDPRYAYDKEKQYNIHKQMKEDVSMTFRKPYPQEHEIGLPRKSFSTPFS